MSKPQDECEELRQPGRLLAARHRQDNSDDIAGDGQSFEDAVTSGCCWAAAERLAGNPRVQEQIRHNERE
ncbi:hypothetical protein ACFY2R_12995 [Micromonospora olivasterospora]|uniref:hypothetical protein n=1 Tax=Micromonospora olivasterospora TaxID=1880 RepID=UPI0011A2CDA1|nr:hypothetical protein [Micromonospora olivasterospora]